MKSRMALVLLMVLGCQISTLAQQSQPTLEQIKIAADAGDPVAQDKLAERYILRTDTAHAEIWYRKAASQGYAHAQGQLGNMLLMHSRMSLGLKPDAHAAITDEALKWITLAASQGDKQGQANLADVCLEGKLVKQDLIEAYKWGDLAGQGSMINVAAISGRGTRDAATLKMNADQIAEARGRVAAFIPHQVQKSELPEPAWTAKIKLNGISGLPAKRFATVYNQTFEKGESKTVKIDGRPVTIQCLEITATTATISIEGVEGTRTLSLN